MFTNVLFLCIGDIFKFAALTGRVREIQKALTAKKQKVNLLDTKDL